MESPPQKVVESPPQKVVESPPQKVVRSPPQKVVRSPPQKVVRSPPQKVVRSPPQKVVESPPQKVVESPPQKVGPPSFTLKRSREQKLLTSTPVGDPLTPPRSPPPPRDECETKILRTTPVLSCPRGARTARLRPARPTTRPTTPDRPTRTLRARRAGRGETAPPAARAQARLDLKADLNESTTSADLELSSCEEPLNMDDEDEDHDEDHDEDDDELPSFLQADKKPGPVSEGGFVWYKHRSFPYWPALVKRVDRRRKRASLVFVDKPVMMDVKGFYVPLRSLKHFDSEEASELVTKAKDKYKDLIEWTLNMIQDYRLRIACGSFSDSFLDYLAHDMSFPARRKFPQTDGPVFAPEETLDECRDSKDEKDHQKILRRRLPDRTLAAYNRANQRLVDYIVTRQKVEARLLAVIRGREPSTWLSAFQSSERRRSTVTVYLEDQEQLDQVYHYLDRICCSAGDQDGCCPPKSQARVSFILEVLLPEAIVHAIAGVDGVSVATAEQKYQRGRVVSNRELLELHDGGRQERPSL